MKFKIHKNGVLSLLICIFLTAIFFFSFGLAGRYPFNYVNILLWGGLGVLYLLWRRVNKKKILKFRLDIFFIAIVVFCLAQVLAYALSGFAAFSKTGLVCAVSSLLFYELLADDVISKKAAIACACIGAVGYLLLFCLVYRSSIFHPNFSTRIGDFFDNQNEVGQNSALCALLLLGVGLTTKNWWLRIGTILFSLIAFYTVLLTGSVSNLLVISLAVLISLPFFFKKRKWIVILVEVVAIAAGLTIIFVVPSFSYYASRITGMLSSLGIGNGRGDTSAESRFNAAYYGFHIFLEHPLFGAGYDAVHRSYAIVAHNNFIEVLADFGIFAFVAHESTIILPLIKLKKGECEYTKIVLPLLVFALLFQFFLFAFDSKSTNLLIVLCFFLSFPAGCYTKSLRRAQIRTSKLKI